MRLKNVGAICKSQMAFAKLWRPVLGFKAYGKEKGLQENGL
jgi:hypothetical protein